jgi:hypothetical protein
LISHIKGTNNTDGVLENRVLRGMFGHKREDLTGDWRKLHKEELHNLHYSPNQEE